MSRIIKGMVWGALGLAMGMMGSGALGQAEDRMMPPRKYAAMPRRVYLDRQMELNSKLPVLLPDVALGRVFMAMGGMGREFVPERMFYEQFYPDRLGVKDLERKEGFAKDYVEGKKVMFEPQADSALMVAIASPFATESRQWKPRAVYLQNRLLVVEIDDPGDTAVAIQDKELPLIQRVYFVEVPAIEKGSYMLRSVVYQKSKDPGKPRVGLKVMEQTFEVLEAGAADHGDGGPVKIGHALDGKTVEATAEELNWVSQSEEYATARKMVLPGTFDGMMKMGLTAGLSATEDIFELMKKDDLMGLQFEHLPRLVNLPAKGEPVYAEVLLPAMNVGEWASVRQVRWNDRPEELVDLEKGMTGSIEVDVWEDNGARLDNVIGYPVMLNQLKPPAIANGGYELELKARYLKADKPGGWYVEQRGRQLENGATMRVKVKMK